MRKRLVKNFNLNTDNNDVWLTPKHVTDALGDFDLDPCCPQVRPWDIAPNTYSLPQDGLALPWKGRVWLNPPYGTETFKWLDRLADHGRGLALIFARTETRGFHAQIWAKAHSVFFFKGRIRFCDYKGTQAASANAPSCLISYSVEDTSILQACSLEGKLVTL